MIYLLEDDKSIAELVSYSLNKTGNEAEGFSLPSEFFRAVSKRTPELVILDVMLPEEDGLSVLSRLKSNTKTADIPVIMLTAKGSEFDKVTALNAGADDYITKPFGVMELIARVGAVLRRSKRGDGCKKTPVSLGELTVYPESRTVSASGTAVVLTYKEFELLLLLLENAGSVLRRDRILSEVWGYGFDGENRTVDVHIRTLRQKLGVCGDMIETVRGVGYKISDSSK